MTAKTGALIWAFAFIAVGALGFIDNLQIINQT